MRFLAILAPLMLVVAPALAEDQDTMRVSLETVNGSRVIGTLKVKTLKVRSDLGNLDVDLEKVRQINNTRSANNGYPLGPGYAPAPAPGVSPPTYAAPAEPTPGFQLIMVSGTIIAGANLEARELQIDCELGVLTIAWEKVRSLEFPDRMLPQAEPASPVPAQAAEPAPAPQARSSTPPQIRRLYFVSRRWLRRMYRASLRGPFSLAWKP